MCVRVTFLVGALIEQVNTYQKKQEELRELAGARTDGSGSTELEQVQEELRR